MNITIDGRAADINPFGLGRYVKNLVHTLMKIDRENNYRIFLCNKPSFSLPSNFSYTLFPKNRVLTEQFLIPYKLTLKPSGLCHFPANHAPFIKKGKSILTLHDTIFMRMGQEVSTHNYFRQRFNYWYREIVIPKAVKNAEKIITVSEYSKKTITETFKIKKDKVVVIHEACDPVFSKMDRKLAENICKRYNFNFDFILGLGSFDKRKNINKLIEVYAYLRKEHNIRHHLVLAGCDKTIFADYLKLVRFYDIESVVHFTGIIPDEDLTAFYSKADVFVFPSSEEGFGLPALEAMACGTPVIAGRAGALPEIVGNAGIFVAPTNSREIKDAILAFLKKKSLREKYRQKGFKRVKEFSWEKTAVKTIEVYREGIMLTPIGS